MRHLRLLLALAIVGGSGTAAAFPWMVRHNYASCTACHVDPSGAGQLTPYGRAQGDVLLRWKPVKTKADEDGEIPKTANFLWFMELPDVINLSGNLRGGVFAQLAPSAPVRPLWMASDLYATINVDRFVFHASSGVGIRNVGLASILPSCAPGQCGVQWVAREYWAGVKFGPDDSVMVRVGRTPLPFGLRNNEHSMWVRDLTNTDINVDQQVGATVAYNSEKVRGELMGIAGNFQISPDAYRERGYSFFAEYTGIERFYFGLSSLITWAQASQESGLLGPTTRHAHGLFARWSPAEIVSILFEGNFIAQQQKGSLDQLGFAAMLQGDFEVVQGIHLMATLEGKHQGAGEKGPSLGGWASVAWYVLPHVEVRVDGIYRRTTFANIEPANTFTLLAQLHVFL